VASVLLQAWIDGFALKSEDTEDALMHAAERFLSDETLQCGWGFAGRLETTALAIEALSDLQKVPPQEDISDLISLGLQ
jgi:hypothetical protein